MISLGVVLIMASFEESIIAGGIASGPLIRGCFPVEPRFAILRSELE